jgi:acyl-CoA reductase-like NAD-dependent aldehyde dehydrogenase
MTLGEAIPALMAGNAVVIKPSELTPLSAIFGAELAVRAGFPENLLQIVVGRGETGEALIDHADMIAFTGGVETGKRVMKRAAERLIPVSLELGGKDPMIVLKDADLNRAASACVWGALMNSGQACTSIERVYVEAPAYQPFVDKVVERVRAIRQGKSAAEVELGSLTSEAQLKTIAAQVDAAVAGGAKALIGGRRNQTFAGFYYEPTVLVDIDHSMTIMTEETFGPVIPIMKVNDAAEALRLANDSRYGLSSSLYAGDKVSAENSRRNCKAAPSASTTAWSISSFPTRPWAAARIVALAIVMAPKGFASFVTRKRLSSTVSASKRSFPGIPRRKRKNIKYAICSTLLCHSGWRHKWRALTGLIRS